MEAKDAEFFDGNGNLYLVFAHKGDFMVANGEDPESTLLKFDDTLAQFRVIQGRVVTKIEIVTELIYILPIFRVCGEPSFFLSFEFYTIIFLGNFRIYI